MNSRRIPFPDDDTLWQDVCTLYEREAAMHRCLRLQDSYGVCVVLVLLAISIGRRGIAIHEGALPAVRTLVEQRYFRVIAPMRAARRAMHDRESHGWRHARELELSLERELLNAVTSILRGRALWNAEEAIFRNIDLILDAHGEELPDAAFTAAGNLGKLLASD